MEQNQMQSQSQQKSQEPSYLRDLKNKFTQKKWICTNSQPNHYVFKKTTFNFDNFELLINKHDIIVKIPLQPLNGIEQIFSTKFNSYYDAITFMEMHLENYDEKLKDIKINQN
jgi:hypothetical protein